MSEMQRLTGLLRHTCTATLGSDGRGIGRPAESRRHLGDELSPRRAITHRRRVSAAVPGLPHTRDACITRSIPMLCP